MTVAYTTREGSEDYISEERVYTAAVDGKEVGVATVLLYDDGDVVLDRIGVLEGSRGQGFGSELIRAIGADVGDLITAPDNADAQRLYERLGEKLTGQKYSCAYFAYDQGYGVYII